MYSSKAYYGEQNLSNVGLPKIQCNTPIYGFN